MFPGKPSGEMTPEERVVAREQERRNMEEVRQQSAAMARETAILRQRFEDDGRPSRFGSYRIPPIGVLDRPFSNAPPMPAGDLPIPNNPPPSTSTARRSAAPASPGMLSPSPRSSPSRRGTDPASPRTPSGPGRRGAHSGSSSTGAGQGMASPSSTSVQVSPRGQGSSRGVSVCLSSPASTGHRTGTASGSSPLSGGEKELRKRGGGGKDKERK